MDGLNDEERALAWKAGWNPSFDGLAIVNEDFTIRSVNKQFCEILGITEAQIIGQRFQDVTPPSMRKLDEANAILLKQGIMDSYVMEKAYDFGDGHTKPVVLLVSRVPPTAMGGFQFYLSRIMPNAELPTLQDMENQQPTQWKSSSPKGLVERLLDFIDSYYKIILIIGGGVGMFVVTVLKAME